MKTLIDNLKKYYGVYLLIIAVLFLILWFPNRAINRYAISAISDGVSIVDTRTGHIWVKSGGVVIDFGTPDKPISKVTYLEDESE